MAELAYAGDLKSLAARIVGSSPTAPTIWSFRARVPQGCGLVSFGCRWGSNPRGGERQADAQRPQRAGEDGQQATEAGADLRSKYADVPPPRASEK